MASAQTSPSPPRTSERPIPHRMRWVHRLAEGTAQRRHSDGRRQQQPSLSSSGSFPMAPRHDAHRARASSPLAPSFSPPIHVFARPARALAPDRSLELTVSPALCAIALLRLDRYVRSHARSCSPICSLAPSPALPCACSLTVLKDHALGYRHDSNRLNTIPTRFQYDSNTTPTRLQRIQIEYDTT